MASIFCIGVPKISPVGYLTRLCKISKNHNVMQVAFLKRVSLFDRYPLPTATAAFPYWDKYYSWFQAIKTNSTYTYNENTKIIVVDGLPAVGKSKLCEILAKEFGLLYMPAPTHQELYITPYGEDLRQLDPKLPEHCKSNSLETFLADPKHVNTAYFQIQFLLMRFEQYSNALLHTLSTGQGVVLDRCIYSDIAFAEAMLKSGFISKNVMKEYIFMREKGIEQLLTPHVIIYLDVPPELVKEKIKKRGNSHEVNSKVFTTKYLTDLRNAYMEKYLKPLQDYSELLIYDWSSEGIIQDVIYDIEKIDFDNQEEPKFEAWHFQTPGDIGELINLYQDKWPILLEMYQNENIPPRELYWTPNEIEAMEDTLEEIPSTKYVNGYNPEKDNLMFIKDKPDLFVVRRSPRDFENRDISLFSKQR